MDRRIAFAALIAASSLGAQAPQSSAVWFELDAHGAVSRGNLPHTSLTASAVSAPRGSLNLVGANFAVKPEGLNELSGKSNYFIGNDPKKWRTNVSHFAKVRFNNVYPGIDLVYYGNGPRLECDFVVAPGADPGRVRFSASGRAKPVIEDGGNVRVGTGVLLLRPVIYQQDARGRRDVAGGYQIRRGRVGFDIPSYDRSLPLIIDPVLVYSTFLGGSSSDAAWGVAVDSAGNAYIIGQTSSVDFPTVKPFQTTTQELWTIFVSKISADGSTLLYSTYLGGSPGTLPPPAPGDAPGGIAVDAAGNAYISGTTYAQDFPTVNPIQGKLPGGCPSNNFGTNCVPAAVVAKLNASGSALVYSTYLGGTGGDGASAIAIDAAGSAYIAGTTSSIDFPTVNPLQATTHRRTSTGLGAKLNPAGSALVYSTYLGGSGNDGVTGIAVDNSANVYVTGVTSSQDFPLQNPLQGKPGNGFSLAFVTKINASGSALVYSSFLSGSGGDQGNAIAVDAAGNAYLTGLTFSKDFPTANAAQAVSIDASCPSVKPEPCGDAFVTKINAAGTGLVYSTFLGGSGPDKGWAIAVDSAGNAHVTGETVSADFPTLSPLQAAVDPDGSMFVAKYSSTGSLLYSTYFGSHAATGYAIAVDASDNAYIAGGFRTVADVVFPVVSALQPANNGGEGGDAVIVKIGPGNSPGVATSPGVLTFPAQMIGTASSAQSITLLAAGSSPLTIASLTASGDFAQTNNCGTSLAAGATCTINVIFAPTVSGPRTGAITITDNAGSGVQSVKLSGAMVAINAGGVVDGAAFGSRIAPGSVGSVFGSNLAPSVMSASSLPLPTVLNGVSVTISNSSRSIQAPLFYVSPAQINFQVPWEFQSSIQAQFTVTVNGVPSKPATIAFAAYAPGIFMLSSGFELGAVEISNSATLAQPVGSVPGRDARPAMPGEYISIFCSGLGAVTTSPPPADGSSASVGTLSNTASAVSVKFNGVAITPSFAGLAPGFVGLYQVDVQVPTVTPAPSAVISVIVGGIQSNIVTIAVQ